MRSTFMGLETAKRGMYTQQSALYTTGHNIANANTPGYTRQRVNFQTTTPYPAVGMNRPQIPGQMGTGVEAGSVQRVREGFLDYQYRTENNKLGYWESKASALSQMEGIMNETTSDGLSKVMNQFWQSLQDLSVTPENRGTRAVVLQRGQAVVDTFHYVHGSLSAIRDDLGTEIGVSLKEINSILKQIGNLNKQIGEVEPHGYLPNDLYDERDRLVDQLSQHLNIKVEKVGSGGNALDIAEGQYKITLVNADGSEGANLVENSTFKQLGFKDSDEKLSYKVPDFLEKGSIQLFDSNGENPSSDIPLLDANNNVIFSQGSLRGMIESYGYSYKDQGGNDIIKGTYPQMLDDLDKMAFSFAKLFNEVHGQGYPLTGGEPEADKKNFFDLGAGTDYKNAASEIKLNSKLEAKDILASSSKDNAGDGKNAINLANIKGFNLSNGKITLEGGKEIDISAMNLPIKSGTIDSFYQGLIGGLGVEAQEANRLTKNSGVLLMSVETNRQSISSVSMDEEMTDMIRFQHAYNAAARNITVVDEMLDKIINGMGIVGR